MNAPNDAPVIFWFRRDLRIQDNRGLYQALKSGKEVVPLFVFDDDIVEQLPADDHRISFIYDSLAAMNESLRKKGKQLIVRKGKPLEVIREMVASYSPKAVYCNLDHEPYGIRRDKAVRDFLLEKGVAMHSCLDHLVMDPGEVLKPDRHPYHVFTPYGKRWKEQLTQSHLKEYPSEALSSAFSGSLAGERFPSLEQLGFKPSSIAFPAPGPDEETIRTYHLHRDYPAREGTTRLGASLRFGTVSVRSIVRKALEWNTVFLNELIWREFYAMILWHYPSVTDAAFKPAYDRVAWRNDETDLQRWMHGETGYPMVDAGMRQLNETGYMHNRLRMVTASFLSKHLLIDWRLGEAYFARKLFDYELSSNNGGWQWSAGTGCDAAPYFRIFNPASQQKRFDPDGSYVRQWLGPDYQRNGPVPMVDHKKARERALRVYRNALHQ